MKSAEFNLPKNEIETEAELHAEETRRAIPSAPKGQKTQPKKVFGKTRRQDKPAK